MMSFWQHTAHQGLSLFFKLLYHQMSWTYDTVAGIVSLGRWKGWVFSVLPDLGGHRILELGYGPGHLQRELLAAGKFAFGIDTSSQMSRQAQQRIRRQGLSPCLIQGQGQHLPFPEDAFDQVVATFPTEYITRTETLQEIYRVLTPGGEFILLPAAWITGRGPLERLASWLFRVTGQAPPQKPVKGVPGSLIDAFVQPLEASGFTTRPEVRQQTSGLLLVICAKKSE